MKTDWDYTALADAYLKRPDYSDDAINRLIDFINIKDNAIVCDIGAGTAHLTLKLLDKGFVVTAVEPNDAMRKNGIKRTAKRNCIIWFDGTGENTGQESSFFDLVTFGSSFNVTDRVLALKESFRILKPGGWFVCMWNHRDLEDDIQKNIENIIKSHIKEYNYGTRRQDQVKIISDSGLFGETYKIEGRVYHIQKIEDCVEAWKSHATLSRQAGDKFEKIVSDIKDFLLQLNEKEIKIPYITKIWTAQKKEM